MIKDVHKKNPEYLLCACHKKQVSLYSLKFPPDKSIGKHTPLTLIVTRIHSGSDWIVVYEQISLLLLSSVQSWREAGRGDSI